MSGHSKWHKIQHKKGKTDQARSNIFTKLARGITVAARQGGGDSTMNFSLRLAIDRAKAENMPKDNIERAIKKGTGELNEGIVLEEILYEGFGPGGIAFLVDCVTDNKNRTVGDMKHVFSKNGGALGVPGSVQWHFEKLGVVRIAQEKIANIDKSEFELRLMDLGIKDINESQYGLEITCPIEVFQTIINKIKEFGIEPDESGLEWIAKDEIELEKNISDKVRLLCEECEEMDDVRAVYTNAK
jgi:YebC/PmpR family DNA-binding regulatory protein